MPRIENGGDLVTMLSGRAEQSVRHKVESTAASANELFAKAESLNPVAILNRGFSYIMNGNQNVRSIQDVHSGDRLDVMLSDGHFTAVVE